MKKLYLKFLCMMALFLFSEMASAQFTMIPDPGFEQTIINMGYDDVLDGQVVTANIAGMYSLYFDGITVTDLTGIQDFTGLQILFVYGNSLTSLDVSNLHSLRELNCGGNSITSLNVAGMSSLETLVFGENPLATLDLSNLPNLKNIHGSSTPNLTQLNITSPGMQYIDLYGSGLTSMDLTNLPLLQTVYLGHNNLTSLQVTGLSALRYLSVSGNNLTELDLTGTTLDYLYCNQNDLTSLNLKGQSSLDDFNTTNNASLRCIEVDDVAFFNSFPFWYKDYQTTYRLDCNVIGIPDANLEQALIDLGHDTALDGVISKPAADAITILDIANKNIGDLTGLEEFTNLIELNCSGNSVSGSYFSDPGYQQLQNLNCSGNPLYSLDVSGMANLTELDLSDCPMWSFSLGESTSLKILKCNNSGLYELDTRFAVNLERLECNHNYISYLDLQNNNALKYVDCSWNSLQNVSFSPNHPLEYFYCNNNQLFRVENFNLPNLKELHAYNNTIYDIDLRNSPNLEYIDISNNQINRIWNHVMPNLHTFICNDNSIPKLQLFGFENLTRLECQNNAMTFLNLKGTAIATLNCTSNYLECISIDNPGITVDNPSFQKDADVVFSETCQTGPFTLIPDVNFETALMRDALDEIIDGQVSTAVIADVTFLNLYQAGISDLTGIQDFTSVYAVNLQDNNLTNLDALNGMDWITSLYCSQNPFVDLDLDGLGLDGVETFYCTDSGMQSINFGDGMPNLYELFIYQTPVTSLDVSMLENLHVLACFENQLTDLNVTGLGNLEELYCYDNQLTTIDLTGVTNLGNFECTNNQITSIDFSQTPYVYSIRCSENQLTELDVSGLSNLYDLHCSHNNLTSLGLSGLTNLESLECQNNQLTSLALISDSVREINCSENKITAINLSNTPNLSEINLNSNYFTAMDLTGVNPWGFSALNNKYLKCIKVNNVDAAESEVGWHIDGDSYFAADCISCANAVLWNENEWIPAPPTSDSTVLIDGTLTITDDTKFCSLILLENASMSVTSGKNIHVSGILDVDSTASLVLENNTNLTQNGNVNENKGEITVKRNAQMRRQDYVYWSSPVSYMNLEDFSPETLTNRFYVLNESTNQFAWTDPTAGEFHPATGYMIRAPNTFPSNGNIATFNGVFTGEANNGDIYVDVYNTPTKGFNMIGNPYASTIDADQFMDDNLNIDALYFWTHGSQNPGTSNYATYNSSGGTAAATTPDNAPNGTIQVGQGFLAKMTAGAPQQGSALFTNEIRIPNNENQFFRTASTIEKHRIWLNLSNETSVLNQILTAYIANATNDIDGRYDGKLIETSGTKLYNLIENSEYVIQGKALPFSLDDVVPLGFKTETAGTFSISIDHVDGLFSNGQDIYIKDNLSGTTHNIGDDAYWFASEAGTFNSRFEIVYQSTLGVENLDLTNVVVFNKNKMLHIDSGNNLMNDVKVFDIRGRLLYEKNSINAKSVQLEELKADNQVLLIQIKLDSNKNITKKAIY